MATIVTYNSDKTLDIEANTTVDGTVDSSGNLILERRNGTTFNGGSVIAPDGNQGPERPQPAGQIALYAGALPPLGWALCDGTAVHRASYPDLFALIGTTYGAGDGSLTFNLPNFKGRVLVGLDAAQTEFDALGEQGGAKTHTLTTAELPAHTHTILGYSSKDDENFTGNVGRLNASDALITVYDKPTVSTGGGAAHNNLQPYSTTNYIISLGTAAPQGGGIAAPRHFKSNDRGTTAQRNTKYGVPSTLAQRVALANQKVIWFNTDLGWNESYYEVTASAGLTALGLVAGTTAGWYPVGKGPHINLTPTAQLSVNFNSLIGGYDSMVRKGGAAWFTNNSNRIQVLRDGRYDIRAWTKMFEGPGAPDFVLQVHASNGTTLIKNIGGGGFTKSASYWSRPHMEAWDLLLNAGQQVSFRLQQGTMSGTSMALHLSTGANGRGGFAVKYVGPPLESN